MPEMDGYELTRSIRAREAARGLKRLPIIACTANALAGEVETCLSAGMDDYLAKPVELKNLQPKLDRWLPLRTNMAAEPESQGPALQAQTPIDQTALARVSAGDAVVKREIFSQFQQANDEDTALLQRAVTGGDSAEVKRLAHLIKGASTMVGALRLAGVCERIERSSQRGDWSSIEASMRDVHHEVAELNLYFAELRPSAPAP